MWYNARSMNNVQAALRMVIKNVFDLKPEVVLTRPDEQFGDFSTNVALQLAAKRNKKPREVAETLVRVLQKELPGTQIAIAGPGFINFTLSNDDLLALASQAPTQKPQAYKNKVVVAEYGDPNPFKVLHAGHLYTDVVGDAVANLYEVAGARVHRVNFGGDVGLHVGRAMWAIIRHLGGEYPEKLQAIPKLERSNWMTSRYVEGNTAYEQDESAKQEIIDCNKRVYALHVAGDKASPFAQIYWTCRQWSYDYFVSFYDRLNSHFEKYYPESENAELGLKTVREQLKKGVYQQSQGAVVFPGEKYGLHTRVFITKEGLPTYEAKDVGLVMAKWQDYKFDVSLIITAHDQAEYMKVVVKSIEQFMPELARRTVHLTHGIVKLAGGIKMSSRAGTFLRATDILDAAAEANKKIRGKDDQLTTVAAVKYGFLKNRIGGDSVYDPVESVNLEGNSGPYLQYAHARARSILAKSVATPLAPVHIEPGERSLVRKISQYPEVVALAVADLAPHHICTYLYELSQTFNRFYEKNRVLGDAREAERLYLVGLYADVLKDGLTILNITAPERV